MTGRQYKLVIPAFGRLGKEYVFKVSLSYITGLSLKDKIKVDK